MKNSFPGCGAKPPKRAAFLCEKRKAPRLSANISLKIPCPQPAERQASGSIVELSDGGAAVKADLRFEAGTLLYLRLPYGQEIRGEVIHVQVSPDGAYRHGMRVHRAGPVTPQVLPPYLGRNRRAARPLPACQMQESLENERMLGGSR
jgi:hypothetical protein